MAKQTEKPYQISSMAEFVIEVKYHGTDEHGRDKWATVLATDDWNRKFWGHGTSISEALAQTAKACEKQVTDKREKYQKERELSK